MLRKYGIPLIAIAFGALGWHIHGAGLGILFAVVGGLITLFVHDVFQTKHSLRRSYPIAALTRNIAEWMRPKFFQYFIESDTDGKPASRADRSFVYAASKQEVTDIFFGTKRDYHKPGQIHIRNSTFPIPDKVPISLAPIVLGPHRPTPATIHGRFGVSDMSFGSLGQNAVESLASGAAAAGVLLSTGEGGLTPYHLNGVLIKPSIADYAVWGICQVFSLFSKRWRREPMPRKGYVGSGNLMIEIGTGKFGFRTATGEFDYEKYANIMANPHCVATKLKLAQGAKPGGGGILPAAKVTKEISWIRGVEEGKDCISPNYWDEFHDVPTLMAFGEKLAGISGKPWGIKIVIGEENFIQEVAEWMKNHPGEGPDFIHVDGGEGGTGAAPLMLADFVGQSIIHAIPVVDNTLRRYGVRDRVVVMSSGKVFNPAQLLIQLCLGSDFVFGARGFMFSLGCIQAGECGLGSCPSGVATHHWWLQRALVPKVKYIRVRNYAETMHKQLIKLLRVVGVHDTFELNRSHITIVAGTHKELGGDQMHHYPPGCDQLRTPPTPKIFGLKAPDGPPKASPHSNDVTDTWRWIAPDRFKEAA